MKTKQKPSKAKAPHIAVKYERFLAVSCSHGKYADPTAVDAVLKMRDRWKPEICVHLGDWCDTTAFRSGAAGSSDESEPVAPAILMAGLRFSRSYDQLMCWMETTKIVFPDCFPAITHSSHMPHSKPPTSLTRHLSRSVVAGYRMMACFRNWLGVMLPSPTVRYITRTPLGIWQRCMEAMLFLGIPTEAKWQKEERLKRVADSALALSHLADLWSIVRRDEQPSDGDKDWYMEKLAQEIQPCGSSLDQPMQTNGGSPYEWQKVNNEYKLATWERMGFSNSESYESKSRESSSMLENGRRS